MKNRKIYSCIVLLIAFLQISSCSDESDNPASGTHDELLKQVHKEMAQQALLKNNEFAKFVDNTNLAKSDLLVKKNYSYNANLNVTTTTITITSKIGLLNNISVIEHIPKEIASTINEIEFKTTPSLIINSDPIIMWHLQALGDYEIDLSYEVIGNYSETGTTFFLEDFYGGDNVEQIYFNGITNDIVSFVSTEILDIMVDNGLVIHGGFSPPIMEGKYIASPLVLKGSNVPTDDLGTIFSDFNFEFTEQNNRRLDLKMQYTIGSDATGLSYETYLVGNFPFFTSFSKVNSHENGETAKTVIVMSGKYIFEGILDLHIGVFMLDNRGNPSGYFIDNGMGRVFHDSDRISYYLDLEKKNNNTKNNLKENVEKSILKY